MFVSVAIPTFNRRQLLTLVLESLANQERDVDLEYEVLVCDDGSTDGTPAMCRELAASYPVRLCVVQGSHSGGPSGPRNEGLAAARGEIIVYLDDDIIPARDFVLQHAKFHRRNPQREEVAVGRLLIPEPLRADPMVIFSDFPYHEMEGQEELGFLYFWSGNLSLKRDFMSENGLFRPDKLLYPIEDMDCGYRLKQRGMRLRYLREAWGEHYPTVKADRVAERGRCTGSAQFVLWNAIGDPWIPRRFGILTPEIGVKMYVERAAKRMIFRLVDQPLTHAILRGLGATNGKRSRYSDIYYYLIFRRHMIAGYNAARRLHRIGKTVSLVPVPTVGKAVS